MKLYDLCTAIEAGYAAGKSSLDAGMLDLVVQLADRTAEIKSLIDPCTAADDHQEAPAAPGTRA